MKLHDLRLEVMDTIGKSMDDLLAKYLKPIESNWQPADLLPDARNPEFIAEINEIQELAKEMDYDLLTVLIGDTITEEALPTYETWLMDIEGINQQYNENNPNGWSKWIRGWTAEENRHGDLLNKYLFLCGRVDMREMEVTTQHLINDGFDIGTGRNPYKNFVYTSFQELATNISHRRVASLVKKTGNTLLAKINGIIAADEARHASAYSDFVKRIFELDPSQMMTSFEDMMRRKIVMPAHFMRQSGDKVGELWRHLSDAAQRTKVYTAQDYINILSSLIKDWDIDKITDFSKNLGIYENPEKLISISLGSAETTLLKLTSAYSSFVNGGKLVYPILIDRVQDSEGNTIVNNDKRFCINCDQISYTSEIYPKIKDNYKQVFSPQTAYQITSFLEGVIQRGTGKKLKKLKLNLAGKTGTTNENTDAWFIGFTSNLVVGVYVGMDNPTPLGKLETGSKTALPIFKDFIETAVKKSDARPFKVSDDIVMMVVDSQTGQKAKFSSKDMIMEAYKSKNVIDGKVLYLNKNRLVLNNI